MAEELDRLRMLRGSVDFWEKSFEKSINLLAIKIFAVSFDSNAT